MKPETPTLAVAPFDAKEAKHLQAAWAEYHGVPAEFTNSLGMKLVLIPPSPQTEASYIGAHEVTQGELLQFLPGNVSFLFRHGRRRGESRQPRCNSLAG